MPRLLTEEEVGRRLAKLDGWHREGAYVTKTFRFKDFVQGIRFVNRVAKVAEKQEHHPDISVRYDEVKLSIQTHSAGGLTAWDFSLAKAVDETARRQP